MFGHHALLSATLKSNMAVEFSSSPTHGLFSVSSNNPGVDAFRELGDMGKLVVLVHHMVSNEPSPRRLS